MQGMARWFVAATAALVAATGSAAAQVKELRIGYQPSPIQDASIAMFETWGAKNGVKIVKVPNSYGVYVEKMTASLTSNSDQYDIIWHNDDWGQTWAHLLEPTDDIAELKYADKWSMAPVVFANAEGKNTVVLNTENGSVRAAGETKLNEEHWIVYGGLIIGQFTSGLAAQASVSRLLFAMGRDGVLPKGFFGRLSARFATPIEPRRRRPDIRRPP